MARTPSEIAALLDDFADVFYEMSGALAGQERLGGAGMELLQSNGEPFDLRELAADLRAYERDHPPVEK
ncbi:hypothetical protein [Sphingomonas asaccharolytica]|uniref:hypothetical protein n=1 Tax=Sphingomonas asaccharolytica TaxID=40681 RepID=UPI000833A686|nr:hypothetical protein [Sphingomonas asaccharolytica]